jgi:hypothetical protein
MDKEITRSSFVTIPTGNNKTSSNLHFYLCDCIDKSLPCTPRNNSRKQVLLPPRKPRINKDIATTVKTNNEKNTTSTANMDIQHVIPTKVVLVPYEDDEQPKEQTTDDTNDIEHYASDDDKKDTNYVPKKVYPRKKQKHVECAVSPTSEKQQQTVENTQSNATHARKDTTPPEQFPPFDNQLLGSKYATTSTTTRLTILNDKRGQLILSQTMRDAQFKHLIDASNRKTPLKDIMHAYFMHTMDRLVGSINLREFNVDWSKCDQYVLEQMLEPYATDTTYTGDEVNFDDNDTNYTENDHQIRKYYSNECKIICTVSFTVRELYNPEDVDVYWDTCCFNADLPSLTFVARKRGKFVMALYLLYKITTAAKQHNKVPINHEITTNHKLCAVSEPFGLVPCVVYNASIKPSDNALVYLYSVTLPLKLIKTK